MPEIKRSKRIQNKRKNKTSTISNQTDQSAPESCPSPLKKTTTEESQSCFGCSQKFAPIRRYKETEWIQCDQCDNWWHAECACIAVEDIDKLIKNHIDYTCALCVLKGSPWILNNHLSSPPVKDQNIQEVKSVSNCVTKDCPKQQPVTTSTENSTERKDCVVIVDNIKSPRKFRASTEIRKEISKFPEIKPKLSFSLPKGGVALEFENKEQANKVLNNWPSDAFGSDSHCHSPVGKKETNIGFLKNIPNFVKTSEIKHIYSQSCTVKTIRRLTYRSTHKPMPVVRIEFLTAEDLVKAKTVLIHYSTNGKPAFLEAERSFKLVRCFNCHRIGHIGKNCVYETRCGNCSATDHTDSNCTNHSLCPNCNGNHHASSTVCPTYQSILQHHRNKQLF